jgi:hypothetical protein
VILKLVSSTLKYSTRWRTRRQQRNSTIRSMR